MVDTHWYRYDSHRYSGGGFDESGEHMPGPAIIEVKRREMRVAKETPKGVWLDDYGRRRFVLLGAVKRYACPTDAEARASFVARKKKLIRIKHREIAEAAEAIRKLEQGYKLDWSNEL